jgi:hypothetical protein
MTSDLMTAPAEADAPPAWATKRRPRVAIFFPGATGILLAVDSWFDITTASPERDVTMSIGRPFWPRSLWQR